MAQIKIINNQETYRVTPGHRGNDPYRYRGEFRTAHDVQGIELVEGYYDLITPFDIDSQQVYYLLYALYRTGDSFHTHHGMIDYIDLYQEKDQQIGYDNMRIINGIDNDEPKFRNHRLNDGFSMMIYDHTHQLQQMGVSWAGYFERLEDVQLIPVYLLGDNDDDFED